ncbi:hypothetical protein [Azoarcus olearius]|uniref:hypothetical protein n=1 Tax=Azoarcus sp. (strain BH72) TaxID=418699 RepID=UPI003AAD1A16
MTQSGGCRDESGRTIPEPVQLLLNLALEAPAHSAGISSPFASCSGAVGANQTVQPRR